MEVSRVQEEVLVTSAGGQGPKVTSYLQLQPNQRYRESLHLRLSPVAAPRYVSHADFGGDRRDSKWFKTVVELKGCPNRTWKSTKDFTLSNQQDLNQNYISVQSSGGSDVFDDGPGASQVYIPGYKFLGVKVQHAN